MAIPEWKRSGWLKRVEDWSYQTLVDQLEENLYIQVLLEEEIRSRNRDLIREEAR